MATGPDPQPTNQASSFKEWMTTILIGIISLTCVAAAIARMVSQDWMPDAQTLVFLLAAALVQFLDRVSKFKFAGMEFEKKVEDLQGRVEELAELSDEGEEVTGERLASLDEAAETIAKEVYRPGLSWEDDSVADYFTARDVEGLRVKAHVSRSRNFSGRYLVQIKLEVEPQKRLADPRVAFFLHHTFRKNIRVEAIYEGEASLTITARSAFVVGIVLSDGTMLRLDLAEADLELSPEDREEFLSQEG